MCEQLTATLNEQRMDMSLCQLLEHMTESSIVGEDQGRGVRGEDVHLVAQSRMSVKGNTQWVTTAPVSGEQTRVIFDDGVRSNHDSHVLCPHAMNKLFGLRSGDNEPLLLAPSYSALSLFIAQRG